MVSELATYFRLLRDALVAALSVGTWKEIEDDHRAVQLSWRKDLEPGWGKSKYVKRVLEQFSEENLLSLGSRCVEQFPGRSRKIQDAIWWLEAKGRMEISEITRLAIADSFDGNRMHPQKKPCEFIEEFAWFEGDEIVYSLNARYDENDNLVVDGAVSGELFGFGMTSARIIKHRDLLREYGFLAWPDRRVLLFLERIVHPAVRQGTEQDEWVIRLNRLIGSDGYGLIQVATSSGHPVFGVRQTDRGMPGNPKNLIFASNGPKPELGFRDAINNDIVILKHADHCLVYDAPLGEEGLLWDQLVAWWAARGGLPTDSRARKELGKRLVASLDSAPEKEMFLAYFRQFRPVLRAALPALIPQVYLHYDPVTLRDLKARGEERRFLVQRMDFLLLLPQRVRVVLEIDGIQHYAEKRGTTWRPSPRAYSRTASSDRELRLAGYEVYRFGADELSDVETAESTARIFYRNLFNRHRLL